VVVVGEVTHDARAEYAPPAYAVTVCGCIAAEIAEITPSRQGDHTLHHAAYTLRA
jgi:hypothetical protein